MWCAVKGKCYAGKPGTIDALKYNIREAIGEILLKYTIDDVLKNWTDRVGWFLRAYFILLRGKNVALLKFMVSVLDFQIQI